MASYTDNITNKYKVSDIDDAASTKYYGFLAADGSWYIMKEDSVNKTYRYTKGSQAYASSWTNRASLVYDLFSEVF